MISRPILTRAATAPLTRNFALVPRSRGYTKDDIEQGLHTARQDMQSHEVRQRQRHELDNSDSSVTAGDDLTPISIDDHEGIEKVAEQAQPNLIAGLRKLLGKRNRRPLSEKDDADSIAAQRKIEYDKIRHHNLEKDHVAGLARLAALQDSNLSWCIFRRFGAAAARILVGKEIELDQLLLKLNELDIDDSTNPDTKYRLHSIDFYEGCDPEQKELLEEIEFKLKDYCYLDHFLNCDYGSVLTGTDDFLLKYANVRDLGPVDARHHRSVHTWMIDNRPLLEGEDTFILSVDDFITASTKSDNSLQHGSKIAHALESYIARRPNSWLHSFVKSDEQRHKTSNPCVHHFSRARLGILERIVASVLAIGTMLIPVLILFLGDMSREKMAAIAVCFVLLFMGTISIFVEVTPHDLFIGVAAFSAVLVSLLSNLTQSSAAGSASS